MTIAIGDTLPDATLRYLGGDGPAETTVAGLTSGKTDAIFGLPGAFTGTCTSAHLPSFMSAEADLRAKGIDEIVCVSVNDIFVMDAWAKSTGADASGIHMLADPEAALTKALGLDFSAPPVGLIDRSKRYSLVAKDGKVTHLNVEESPGVCELSAGQTLVDQLG